MNDCSNSTCYGPYETQYYCAYNLTSCLDENNLKYCHYNKYDECGYSETLCDQRCQSDGCYSPNPCHVKTQCALGTNCCVDTSCKNSCEYNLQITDTSGQRNYFQGVCKDGTFYQHDGYEGIELNLIHDGNYYSCCENGDCPRWYCTSGGYCYYMGTAGSNPRCTSGPSGEIKVCTDYSEYRYVSQDKCLSNCENLCK